MGFIRIQGCPRPHHMTLRQRLKPLLGSTLTVYVPGSPKVGRLRGRLLNIGRDSFVIGTHSIGWESPFYIVVPAIARFRMHYEVVATAKDLGSLVGKLIGVGHDFVEFIQIPGSNVPTIFPLNSFTEVACSHQGEE
ncbi:hypothetical protein [Paenibacillus puerhi]|uniref:hypothetical protein n=1 Tax=Paenibacillus puerhi TaxID=2692622 RepID=UPI001F231D6B|nr:hypothetical protein [Paenibacillus puerhi]